jgi:hypothetical protein
MLGTVNMADTFAHGNSASLGLQTDGWTRISAPSDGGGSLSEKYCGCRAGQSPSCQRRMLGRVCCRSQLQFVIFSLSPAAGVKVGTLLVRRFGRRVPLRYRF